MIVNPFNPTFDSFKQSNQLIHQSHHIHGSTQSRSGTLSDQLKCSPQGFPQFNPPTNEFLASNYRTNSSIKSKGPVPSQKIFQFVSPLTIFVFRKLWWVRSTSTWCSPPATGTCTATCEPAEDFVNQTLATSSGKSLPPSTRRTSRASCLGISSFASSSSPTSQGKAGSRIFIEQWNVKLRYDERRRLVFIVFCIYLTSFPVRSDKWHIASLINFHSLSTTINIWIWIPKLLVKHLFITQSAVVDLHEVLSRDRLPS